MKSSIFKNKNSNLPVFAQQSPTPAKLEDRNIILVKTEKNPIHFHTITASPKTVSNQTLLQSARLSTIKKYVKTQAKICFIQILLQITTVYSTLDAKKLNVAVSLL